MIYGHRGWGRFLFSYVGTFEDEFYSYSVSDNNSYLISFGFSLCSIWKVFFSSFLNLLNYYECGCNKHFSSSPFGSGMYWYSTQNVNFCCSPQFAGLGAWITRSSNYLYSSLSVFLTFQNKGYNLATERFSRTLHFQRRVDTSYIGSPCFFFFLNSLIFPHLLQVLVAVHSENLVTPLLVYIIHGTGKALQNINKIGCQKTADPFFVRRLVETVLRKYLCMCNKCLTALASFLFFCKRSICFLNLDSRDTFCDTFGWSLSSKLGWVFSEWKIHLIGQKKQIT